MKPTFYQHNHFFASFFHGIRRDIINMAGRSGHVACALSCVEIIAAALCEGFQRDQDKFILSKGHAAMSLYAILANLGYFDKSELHTYCLNNSLFAEHPLPNKISGVDFATGSLGHGLAIAVGLAFAMKLKQSFNKVIVLLGDGECDEGSVWEAATLASALHLNNLIAAVDMNGLQACGSRATISNGVNLSQCWEGAGWATEELDGHDYGLLSQSFQRKSPDERPRVLLCRTVKGKGIDFMENNLEWHYRPVRGEEKEAALLRLQNA